MLVVFVALGVGMALPYVPLAWFPGWRRRLPRPGPWLERFKQVLAFPLYATVIWLAWVLGAQRDNDARAAPADRAALRRLRAVGVAHRAHRRRAAVGHRRVRRAGRRGDGRVAAVRRRTPRAPAKAAGAGAASDDREWTAFTPATVAALTASGRPVFVDFTAAWCVTCQVNKRLVLNADDVRARVRARSDVALVRADWTRRDPAITQALAALGPQRRSGLRAVPPRQGAAAAAGGPAAAAPMHDALATL